MMMDDGYYSNNNVNYRDDRWQKKMKSRLNNVADPIIQDFGTKDEWEASKHGLQMARGGRNNNVGMGAMVNSVGDDMIQVNDYERDVMMEEEERRQREQMMVAQEEEEEEERKRQMFDGEGGNFWMNPMNRMDRYPSPQPPPPPMNGRRRNNRRRRRRNNRDDDGDWWETKRAIGEDFFDDDDIDEYYDDDEEYDYGIPPPSRSRSSFRSGGPSPPRPIKGFYDKLFWFGFDPDVTRPTDRTMFGGARGKFNALDLLRDREEREQRRRMRDMRRGGRDPVIQDFGNAGVDWDVKKFGKGRTGGDLTSDDQTFMENGVRGGGGMPPPPFPGDMPPMDDMPPPPPGMEPDLFDDELMAGNRRRGRRNRRNRRRGRRNDDIDGRAAAYDRFIGLGPMDDEEYIMIDDEEDVEFMPGRSRRRRRGYAYKLDDDDFDDDDEYIDIEASYPAERDDMSSPRRGRRSWEERALEMDRVPPRGVAAWGPNGPVSDDVQTMAAMDAMDEIKRAKNFLEKKEEMVEDAKEEVVALKADATFYERQLDGVRGSAARTLEKELGLVLRDVEDSQRMLRMARAERDAASRQVENLEARHWALLSEYEATQSFDD